LQVIDLSGIRRVTSDFVEMLAARNLHEKYSLPLTELLLDRLPSISSASISRLLEADAAHVIERLRLSRCEGLNDDALLGLAISKDPSADIRRIVSAAAAAATPVMWVCTICVSVGLLPRAQCRNFHWAGA
jgi:hypothetical protein